MFNVFKKNSKGTIENQCSEEKVLTPEVEEVVQDQNLEKNNAFSAKDALEKTSQQWKNVSTEKIFEEINRRIKFGTRSVCFPESVITDEQKQFLEELGYEVKIEECHFIYKTPFVSVYW